MKRLVLMLVTALVLSFPLSADAHQGRAYVWRGELPHTGLCPLNVFWVHDRDGNTYLNQCVAAWAGVRLVWQGEGGTGH